MVNFEFLPSHFSTYLPMTLCRKVALNGFFLFSIIYSIQNHNEKSDLKINFVSDLRILRHVFVTFETFKDGGQK